VRDQVVIERGEGEYVVRAEQWIGRTPEELFPFYGDARNLEKLTPPWLRFAVLTPEPIDMRAGALIDYRLRVRGIPIRWRTRIVTWEPPHRFIDEQARGPYRQWIHEHTFDPADGGTLVADTVRYLPRGGSLVNKLFVAPDVKRIFKFRQERLTELFGGGGFNHELHE